MSALSVLDRNYHFDAVFSAPLRSDFSLIVKIAHVVFHILTFGIPLAVYYVVQCCLPKSANQRALEEAQRIQTLRRQAIQRVKEASIPFSNVNDDEIKALLEQNGDFIPTQFLDAPESVQRVAALLYERYLPCLVDRLRISNPWSATNSALTTDQTLNCFRLAYAAGTRLLEHPQKMQYKDRMRICCAVALVYRIIRFALAVLPQREYTQLSQWGSLRSLMSLKENEKAISLLRIKKATTKWGSNFYSGKGGQNIRLVYNHYCQWVIAWVSDPHLLSLYPFDEDQNTFELQFKAYI